MSILTESICSAARELGYPSVKPEQMDVVRAFMGKKDCSSNRIWEKSCAMLVCHSPLIKSFKRRKDIGYSLVIVGTPLLAIMKDHVGWFRVYHD